MPTYDVKIQDVSMTTPSWAVDTFEGRRVIPRRREVSVELPGVNGVVPYVAGFEPSSFRIGMWIAGSAPGVAPSATQLEANIDAVFSALFQRQLLKFEWLHPSGVWRRGDVRLVSDATPAIDHYALDARLDLVFDNPACFWRGPAELSTPLTKTFGVEVKPALFTSPWSGVADDGRLEITGPISNPDIVIESHVLRFGGSIADGEKLIINNKTMTATIDGVSQLDKLTYQGQRFFELTPNARVTITGSATTTATAWQLFAVPAYS